MYIRSFLGIAAVLTLVAGSPTNITEKSTKPIIIERNFGGYIDAFNNTFFSLQATDTKVVLKGWCLSACSRFMRLRNICAGPDAYFGFHAARNAKDDTLLIKLGKEDAEQTDLPAAFVIEQKYDAFSFGFEKLKPGLQSTLIEQEPGIEIYYNPYKDDIYQKFLLIKASMLIRSCTTEELNAR